jgi:hypothetical protein
MIDPQQYDGFATPEELNLSPEEVEQLKKQKHELTNYGKEKIRKLKAQKIVEATMEHTLRPRKGDRERVIAAVLRSLIEQYGYDNYHVDGDHGLLVVNVRDILGIIEVLEE